MEISDVLALTKAGWSKDEIIALASIKEEQPQAEQPKPEAKPEAKPEGKPEAKPDGNNESEGKKPESSQAVTFSDEQFQALLQKLNMQNANVDLPPKKDVSFILGEHFRGVFGTDQKGDK